MPEREFTRVVVLGRNYANALGVIRALGRRGLTVDLIYVSAKKGEARVAEVSRFLSHTFEVVGRKDEEILNLLFTRVDVWRGCLLLSTDDYTTALLDQNREKLSVYYELPYMGNHKPGRIVSLMNKRIQLDLARQAGLMTPHTWEISLQNDQIEIPEDISYPCFCKPRESIRGFKRDIGVIRSREELKERLGKLRDERKDRAVLIQELLEIEEEYSISGICWGESVFLPALLKKLRIAEREKGATLLGEVCPFPDDIKETMKQLHDMLGKLEYHGFIDIEVIRSKGNYYFNEINFRSSGVLFSVVEAGINLPFLLVELMEGKHPCFHVPNSFRFGMVFLYDREAWVDYIHGFCSRKECLEYEKRSDVSLLNQADDIRPWIEFKRQMRIFKWKKRILSVGAIDRLFRLYKRRRG